MLQDRFEFDINAFATLVNDAAGAYEREEGREIPAIWRDTIIQLARNNAPALKHWTESHPTSVDHIRDKLYEQFDDVWTMLQSRSPADRQKLLNGDQIVIASIARNCRFVFWCWEQGRGRTLSANA